MDYDRNMFYVHERLAVISQSSFTIQIILIYHSQNYNLKHKPMVCLPASHLTPVLPYGQRQRSLLLVLSQIPSNPHSM